MNALSFTQIAASELATLGLSHDIRHLIKQVRKPHRKTRWCKILPGFGQRIYASGRIVYIVQAFMGGRTRTVTLGDSRFLSQAQARKVAAQILLRVQCGQDPAETRQKVKAIPLYCDFLAHYWSKMTLKWKASTIDRNLYYRKNHLDNAFGRKFLDQITSRDVQLWFANITENSGPEAANRSLEILRALFNMAESRGILPDASNPCHAIKKNPRKKHMCLLSSEELARFGQALDMMEETAPMAVAAIRIITLTGCRKSEIAKLCWSEVRNCKLLLHDSKTGPRTIWIGKAVRQQLDHLPQHERLDNVFWRNDMPLKLPYLDSIYRKTRKMAGLEQVRLHDLRHSYASHAATMSETLPMIGKLLGHKSLAMTARYTHLDDKAIITANETIGNAIARMMGDKRKP